MDWKQRALYALMSDISEECYCAGWIAGNEYAIWKRLSDTAKSRDYGQGKIEDWQVADLCAMSKEIGGWIRWRDDDEDPNLPANEWGAVFTPMAEWLVMYEKNK